MSKPSDLIPELQGRFPLRVELKSLDSKALALILSKPKNSLLKQYIALLKTENIDIEFSKDGIEVIAELAAKANQKIEDIGARRLHTIMEKLLEDISFDVESYQNKKVTIDADFVKSKLEDVVEDVDIAKYIL